jgi:hypothetical protein
MTASMRGHRALLTGLLLFGSASICVSAAPPAPRPRLTAEQAVAAATGADGLKVLAGLDAESHAPDARNHAQTGLWTVDFALDRRPVFRVTLQDGDGAIASQGVIERDGRVRSARDVLDRVRDLTPVRRTFEWYTSVVLLPQYDCRARHWRVVLLADGRVVGDVFVDGDTMTVSGVAEPQPKSVQELLRQVWDAVRPYFSTRQWLYLYMLVFALLFIDWRRPASVRTLDVAMIALAAPIGWLLRAPFLMLVGYSALFATTLYLFARTVWRGWRRQGRPPTAVGLDSGRRSRQIASAAAPGRRALIALAVLLLAHQLTISGLWPVFTGERSVMENTEGVGGPGHGGLVGGERLFATGAMPYGRDWPGKDGWMGRGFDIYGPFHYLVHGLAAQVWPSGRDWRSYDAETDWPVKDDTGARVVAFLFHLLTVAALVGIGRKHFGDARLGWLFAVGYLLLATNMGYLLHGSRRLPAALVALAFWAFPRPILSGVLLGLGAMSLWFPAFLFPLWLSAFRKGGERCVCEAPEGATGKRLPAPFRRRAALKFALAFAAVCAVFLAISLYTPQHERLDRRLRTVLDATAGYEEGVGRADGWRADPTGFWGQLIQRDPRFRFGREGTLIAYLVFCGLLFLLPWRKSAFALAALTAAVILGTQLWKSTRTGEYIGWYAPMLVVALFAPLTSRNRPGENGP